MALYSKALADMDAQWAEWAKGGGMPLDLRTTVLCSFPVEVLRQLCKRFDFTGVHSYAESGLRHTYARDLQVQRAVR